MTTVSTLHVLMSVATSATLCVVNPSGDDPTLDELLIAGRYIEIPQPKPADEPHAHAAWALAQFHLRPGVAPAEAAKLAHEADDDLGSFTFMLCHRTGVGVRREWRKATRLSFALRTKLEQKEDPTPLELYMLSQCQPGDENGEIREADPQKVFAEVNRQKRLIAEWRRKAVELGVAQACHELALAQRQPGEMLKWHNRAAELGLGAAGRYAGLFLVLGNGVPSDPERGIALSKQAAERGDVYAMVNLAQFYFLGQRVPQDTEQAQKWMEQAAKSGHWYGNMERGMASMIGHYGYEIDREVGLEFLQKSVESGAGEALRMIATFYYKGVGFKKDGLQAVNFAEAAYRQGDAEAIRILAAIYKSGIAGVDADKDLSFFWQAEATQPGFGLRTLSDEARAEFEKRIADIDPFALVIE